MSVKKLYTAVFGFLFVLYNSGIYAQDDLDTYTLDETIVTATKKEDKPENIPQPVTVISRDDIQRQQAYNVGEMLDYVPGVRIIKSGTVGASNGVSIRSLNGGPSSSKTLVLIDGRPVNEGWSGGVNWHAIPTEQVERVEVMRGPGSALYGSQASGGVISVFTKKPAPGFHGWFSLGSEINMSEDIDNSSSDGYGRAEISAKRIGINGMFGGDRSSHFLSLGYRDAQQKFPSPNKNKWENYDIYYKVSYDVSEDIFTSFSLNAHNNTWDNKAERSPGENCNDYTAGDVFARWRAGNGVLTGRMYVNHDDSQNTVYGVDLKTGTTATRTGFMTDYSLPVTDNSMVIAGIDAYYDKADVDYEQTVMKMTYRDVAMVNVKDRKTGDINQVEADTFDGSYGSNSQSYNVNNIAVFTQYSHTLIEKLNIVIGGRFDVHSEFGSIFNPKAGLTYELFEKEDYTTTLKVNYGTAFRAPPMWGTFSKSVGGYGDPDLKPEKTKNIDIGIFQRFSSLGSTELTFFHMDVTDLIINDKMGSTGEGYYVFVPTTAGVDTVQFNQRKNLGSYSPKGVELGMKINPHRQISIKGAYTYLDPGDFTFQTSNNRFNIGLNCFVPAGPGRLEGEMMYNHTGDGYFFDYESRPYDAFGLTDARITYDYMGKYRISLVGKNLTDEKYKLWHYAWQPGRTMMVTIESKF